MSNPTPTQTKTRVDDIPTDRLVDAEAFLTPILFGLDQADLHELAEAAIEESYAAGDMIIQEGDEGDAVYFIVSGHVEVIKQFSDGSERFLHSSGPGEPVGEMAMLQEGGRTATVRASTPLTVLRIDREPFLKVLGRSPSLAVRILVRLTGRLRDADQQAISDLSEANKELSRALKQLERLDKTKTDFIQVSAHELRTPVAALLGYAQMMQQNSLARKDTSLRALVDGVVSSTERLHRIFNSILDVSRLMTDGLNISQSPLSMAVIFEAVQSEFADALKKRKITLQIKGLDNLPICSGDPDLMYKVFYHLMNNAIKYTPDGGAITVTGRKITMGEHGPGVEVIIEDTGIGIDPNNLELIFEKFYRTGEVALHSSGNSKFKGGGPGLGLAIAKGVIEAHGGRIWAESPGYDEDECPGSKFFVQIPRKPNSASAFFN
ncbi:MAG TPA: cyclic nucleotide-binding domain-containing protein [Chloroflexi bacterium]|nr:cyclic nucleotide-binding domain-containing protein [Chloroflexota bacterium]